MRRPIWIVTLVTAVALTAYLFAKPATAPADPKDANATNSPKVTQHPDVLVPPAANDKRYNQPSQIPSSPASPQLPITKVVLYSSGVGYFQRDGKVDGNVQVDLAFPTQDVNDLLKSMVLQDQGGGHISAVGFDSQDPVGKTLNSFAINLADNPTHGQILNQARGEKVEVTLPHQYGVTSVECIPQPAGMTVTLQGTILGVADKAPTTKDGAAVEMLNLWCADGMRNVPLAAVQRVRFLNPTVESEVQRALQVLANGHDTEKKAVSLQFSGTGKRSVSVGYVVEAPLWRTSYRLLVGKDGKLSIQGWALVQNPTNDDWKDVGMALVSGRPMSFKMDLYQPLYVPRPVVQPKLYASLRPTTHNGAMVVNNKKSNKAPPNGSKEEEEEEEEEEASPAVAMARPTRFAKMANVDGVLAKQPEINLQRGIVAAATAADLGDSFQYAIEHVVTIPRQKSALLPIVNKTLEGDKVSLYSPQVNAKYPLLALRLKNTTGVHLMQGPVAVFEGTGYCGDAQLPDLQPKEDRLVSYALDLGTEVQTVPAQVDQRLVSIRLQKGLLTTSSKRREAVTYQMKNRSPHDRVILVEHPVRPGYKLVSKDEPKEQTRDAYRFETKLAAGKTIQLAVVEEQDVRSESSLTNLDVGSIRYLLQHDFSNVQMKEALERLLKLQDELMVTRQGLAGVQQELADITRDQDRLRANLKEMPATADAYKRYLAKFDSQETAIEKLQVQFKELQVLNQKQCRECEVYLNGLDLEATIRKSPPGAGQLQGSPRPTGAV